VGISKRSSFCGLILEKSNYISARVVAKEARHHLSGVVICQVAVPRITSLARHSCRLLCFILSSVVVASNLTDKLRLYTGIRDHVVQAVELKFNCFFLMPLIDDFPTCLREELEAAYEEDLDEVFDVSAVRCALDERLKSLESELHQVGQSEQLCSVASLPPALKKGITYHVVLFAMTAGSVMVVCYQCYPFSPI
jgi:hypothetical protein